MSGICNIVLHLEYRRCEAVSSRHGGAQTNKSVVGYGVLHDFSTRSISLRKKNSCHNIHLKKVGERHESVFRPHHRQHHTRCVGQTLGGGGGRVSTVKSHSDAHVHVVTWPDLQVAKVGTN